MTDINLKIEWLDKEPQPFGDICGEVTMREKGYPDAHYHIVPLTDIVDGAPAIVGYQAHERYHCGTDELGGDLVDEGPSNYYRGESIDAIFAKMRAGERDGCRKLEHGGWVEC